MDMEEQFSKMKIIIIQKTIRGYLARRYLD